MPAAFSRLQLAAALIEYDNDTDNPDVPRRSAQESAIFAHLRRNPAARPDLASRKSSNHAGAAHGQRPDGDIGRDSIVDPRRSAASRGSLDALRNPFGADGSSEYDDDGQEGQSELEVDLSSWGLDAFIPKEKPEKSRKGKEKQGSVPVRSRTISGGPQELGELANGVTHSRSPSTLTMNQNMRRQSTSSRLDFVDDTQGSAPRHRSASYSSMLIQSTTVIQSSTNVPFPSPRPHSPGYGAIDSFQEQAIPRSQSRASLGSRMMLDETGEQRPRSMSLGTTALEQAADNPFALGPPTHTSRFDPKAAQPRAQSVASFNTRQALDNDDGVSVKSHNSFTQNRPYSVVELLRPKVLVMPSPLQSTGGEAPQPNANVRDGFQLSKDGPPLPPGARTSRRLSMNLDSVPNPSNSFIPNPTADLTPAQKIFRDTLVAREGSSSAGPDSLLPRAQNDGEQVEFEPPEPEDETLFYGADQGRPNKPAGKLYGKSLIDDLEARKVQMRNKQRVFYGDQRPTMMDRGSSNRTSTLIDSTTLDKPINPRRNSQGSQSAGGLMRRGSTNKPLISFDAESKHHQELQAPGRIPKNKSVFGVDTLWEQEMAKLREIQERERVEEENRRKREEEEARAKALKQRSKRKLRKKGLPDRWEEPDEAPSPSTPASEEVVEKIPEAPPLLPDIKPAIVRKAPKVDDDDDGDSTDSDDREVVAPKVAVTAAWHSDSEDEVKPKGPLRTTGVGLRNPTRMIRSSDSEEDLPLAATRQQAVSRYNKSMAGNLSDSDEDKPLARVMQEKSPSIRQGFPSQMNQGQSDDEDSQPLGIRVSRMMLGRNEDDDDKPLAFHPEQQRRTQYNMLAQQQQQQQQQLMMHAHMQNSMFFNPPMVPTPFYGPPMMNPMMMHVPIPVPSPPPMQDESKFLSVDRWRRDVAVDGEKPQ